MRAISKLLVDADKLRRNQLRVGEGFLLFHIAQGKVSVVEKSKLTYSENLALLRVVEDKVDKIKEGIK